MRFLTLLFAMLVTVSGCADFPRDPDGTLERIRAEGAFEVGLIAPAADQPYQDRRQALIDRVAAATGARPLLIEDSAEALLARLRDGDLDLVLGTFHRTSPWAREVEFLPPLREYETHSGRAQLSAAAKMGENGWIALLYRQSRAVAAAQ